MANTTIAELMPTVFQTAYVTSNIDRAAELMKSKWNIPHFLIIDEPEIKDQHYRGKPAFWKAKVGQGFAGDMNIELIEPVEGETSVYSSQLADTGFSLSIHHFGVLAGDSEADLNKTEKALEGQGYPFIISGFAPGMGKFGYIDLLEEGGHFLEVAFIPQEGWEFFAGVKNKNQELSQGRWI